MVEQNGCGLDGEWQWEEGDARERKVLTVIVSA